MRRVLLLTLLALAFPAAASAATVKTVGCARALAPAARGATFEAKMKAVKGTARMQVRFTLQVRADGATSWRRVSAAGFDTWLSSQTGVRRYSYTRTIQNLAAPADYRTTVRFRWLDAVGDTLRSARDTSSGCRQPDLRPDLEILGVEILPATRADQRRYTVTVRNAGRSAAAAFDLGLRVGDVELGPLPVFGLDAGADRSLTVTGPACTPDAAPVATADAGAAIGERDEDDNVLAAACPG